MAEAARDAAAANEVALTREVQEQRRWRLDAEYESVQRDIRVAAVSAVRALNSAHDAYLRIARVPGAAGQTEAFHLQAEMALKLLDANSWEQKVRRTPQRVDEGEIAIARKARQEVEVFLERARGAEQAAKEFYDLHKP